MNKPPEHLSAEAAGWWQRLSEEFDLSDPGAELLLQTALESFDRMRDAQRLIAEQGAAIVDRFEQTKPHPLLPAERDARGQMLAALKALNLDVDPTRGNIGRPPGR